MAEPTRWKFYDPALLWILAGTYVIHLLEEWFATAPILLWALRLDRPLNAAGFLVPSACGVALMMIGVSLASRGVRYYWIVPALATEAVLNSAGHLVGSIVGAQYSAGLGTAIVLWVPLGLLVLLRVWDQAGPRTRRVGVAAGVVIEVVVVVIMSISGR